MFVSSLWRRSFHYLTTESFTVPKASKLVNQEKRCWIKQFLVAKMMRFLDGGRLGKEYAN